MKNHALPSLLVLAVAATAGCRALPEPVCQSRLLVPVVRAVGPRQATVNQRVTYNLQVKLGNSCGVFDTIVTNQVDDLTGTTPIVQQVGVRGKYTGCTCTTDTTALTAVSYQFQPTKAGTYYLRFLTRQSGFLTDTLTVR